MTDNYLSKALELFASLASSVAYLARLTKWEKDPVAELLEDITDVLLYLSLADGFLGGEELNVLKSLSGIDDATPELMTERARETGLRWRSAKELTRRSVEAIDGMQEQARMVFGYTGDVMPSVILLFELSCLSMLEAMSDGQRKWAEDAASAILRGIHSHL